MYHHDPHVGTSVGNRLASTGEVFGSTFSERCQWYLGRTHGRYYEGQSFHSWVQPVRTTIYAGELVEREASGRDSFIAGGQTLLNTPEIFVPLI